MQKYSSAGLQFYVEIIESDPKVWRRMIVPYEFSFFKLHLTIQGAFGWENSHLFMFSETGFNDKLQFTELSEESNQTPGVVEKDVRKAKIKTVFHQDNKRLIYIYDFGDNWGHFVVFEKFFDGDIMSPYCIEGRGACPPEDCGGLRGYAEMLRAFENPGDPEAGEYRNWLGMGAKENWDADKCNIREINKRLCLIE